LKEVCSDIILIPKTFVPGVHKVEKGYGIPYLTGKELFLSHPVADTFITSSKPELIERLLVNRGMTLVTCGGTVGKAMYVRGLLENMAVIHHAIRVVPNETLHPGYVYAWLASDAGWAQMQRCAYGSVIPMLHRRHVEDVLIPVPSDNGRAIGELIDTCFDKRQEAASREDDAVQLFTNAIVRGSMYIESEWGTEY
jgi:type I restriction enzyme S subunit